jgi:hypothetical protein
MPDREEILHSLIGAWRLARLDPRGMNEFNISIDGFWRSFFAAVLVAPGYAILIAYRFGQVDGGGPDPAPSTLAFEGDASIGWIMLVQTASYLLSWAAFPLIAAVVTWALDLGRNYVALIVAANWAAVIQIGAFLAAILLGAVFPGGLASALVTIATIAILFYQWFVTRTALQTTAGIAFALVLADLLVNTAINLTADGML